MGATSGQGPAGGGCGGGGVHGAGGREVVGWGTEAEFHEATSGRGGGHTHTHKHPVWVYKTAILLSALASLSSGTAPVTAPVTSPGSGTRDAR